MPKATPPINNFNAGELSPLIDARFDINKYMNGCRTLENAFPLVEGGAKKLPGTYYITTTKSSGKARLVPFSFSTIQAYQLEFGNLYIRFFKDKGQIIIDPDYADEFDPSLAKYVGQHVKFGVYHAYGAWGDGKQLVIRAEYEDDTPITSAIRIVYDASATDEIVITASGADITIALANTTPAKNSAALIQEALRAYDDTLCGGWTVCESAAYAADRPVTGGGGSFAAFVDLAQVYRCKTAQSTSADNTQDDPQIASSKWTLVTVGDPVEIITPYLLADLFELDVNTQSADVLYIFHSAYPPATLTRHSHINWEYAEMDITGTEDITKTSYGGIGKSINSIAKASETTVKCKAHGFSNDDLVYINHVLGMLEINQGVFKVSDVATNTFKIKDPDTDAYIDSTDFSAAGTNGFAVKVVSRFNSAGEYPSCGTFFEQRLCLAGFTNHPLRINLSVSGDFTNFISDPESADYAIQWDLVSSKNDCIRWVIGQQHLMVGTQGGVWRLGPSSSAEAMSQTNFDVKKQIFIGAGTVAPQPAGDSLIWITRSASVVRLLQYVWDSDKWVSPDLTRVARHIAIGETRALSGIVQTAFQSEPYPIVWAIRNDGQLLGMTFESQEQVYAWFRKVTDGIIESVCVTSQDNDEDLVMIIVQRTINGSTVRYVEYFTPQELFGEIKDSFFVDSGLTWDGGEAKDIGGMSPSNPCVVTVLNHGFSPGDKVRITGVVGMTEANQDIDEAYTVGTVATHAFQLYGVDAEAWTTYESGGIVEKVTNSITGLSHLEGETVDILADGAVCDQQEVSSGVITLDRYANKVHVGLPYTAIIEPMKLNAGGQGTSRGKKQKINRVTLCFHETVGGKYGKDQDHLFDIPWGTGANPVLHTEDITKDFEGNWEDEATISIVSDQPLPMTLKAIIPRVTVNEEQ